MEVKIIIDLSDRAVAAIDKLANALSVKNESPWLNSTAEEKPVAKPVKKETNTPAKPAKEAQVEETTEEALEINEATLRAKIAEASAAGLKDNIKAYLKANFKTLKIADLDPTDYAKVYQAVSNMLEE